MRMLLVCTIAALMVVAAGSLAFAQYEEPSKLSLKIGLYQPSGSFLRSEGGSTWTTMGVNYDLTSDHLGRPVSSVMLDRSAESGRRFDGQMTGISYTRLWHQSAHENRGAYVGAAAGAYLLKADVMANYDVFPPTEAKKHSAIKPGIMLIGGYNVTSTLFAELRYSQVSSLGGGMNFSGLTLSVGAKGLL